MVILIKRKLRKRASSVAEPLFQQHTTYVLALNDYFPASERNSKEIVFKLFGTVHFMAPVFNVWYVSSFFTPRNICSTFGCDFHPI